MSIKSTKIIVSCDHKGCNETTECDYVYAIISHDYSGDYAEIVAEADSPWKTIEPNHYCGEHHPKNKK